MRNLKDYEGETIIIRSLAIDETTAVTVKLHLVEASGIWVESQKFTDEVLRMGKTSMSPRTAVIFVPWSHISWILVTVDVPSISDSTTD